MLKIGQSTFRVLPFHLCIIISLKIKKLDNLLQCKCKHLNLFNNLLTYILQLYSFCIILQTCVLLFNYLITIVVAQVFENFLNFNNFFTFKNLLNFDCCYNLYSLVYLLASLAFQCCQLYIVTHTIHSTKALGKHSCFFFIFSFYNVLLAFLFLLLWQSFFVLYKYIENIVFL